jgi:hypothetical protein
MSTAQNVIRPVDYTSECVISLYFFNFRYYLAACLGLRTLAWGVLCNLPLLTPTILLQDGFGFNSKGPPCRGASLL